jgi:hypothetical protein
VPRSALFAYPPPSKPHRRPLCPTSVRFRTFLRCEATVLTPCPLNIIYYNRFAQKCRIHSFITPNHLLAIKESDLNRTKELTTSYI